MNDVVKSRLSLNQATIKRASLREAVEAAQRAGLESIGAWREPVAEIGLEAACGLVSESGLRFSSLCRGGFFTSDDADERKRSIDDNRRAIDETAALAAAGGSGSRAALVLVVGGLPEGSRDIVGARSMVSDGIGELHSYAQAAGVQLAIEPLHPMYAADRSVVTSLRGALDLAADFDPAVVGVIVDVFHLWWDADVLSQISRAGAEGRISAYQVSDWKAELEADPLLSRHYPGDGVIDFATLTRAVLDAGYDGDIEVEIFNQAVWDSGYDDVLGRVVAGFEQYVGPHLETVDR